MYQFLVESNKKWSCYDNAFIERFNRNCSLNHLQYRMNKYILICTKPCLFVEVMRLEKCLNDENIGPQGYSLSNLTITSVICYVASVVVPDSVVVNTPD